MQCLMPWCRLDLLEIVNAILFFSLIIDQHERRKTINGRIVVVVLLPLCEHVDEGSSEIFQQRKSEKSFFSSSQTNEEDDEFTT